MIELSIISAESKKTEIDIFEAEKEAKRKIYEAQRSQRVEKLTEQIFNTLKTKIENSKSYWNCITITEDHFNKWGKPDMNELQDAFKVVAQLFITAGYKTHGFCEYGKSWRTRSGKVGYINIDIK